MQCASSNANMTICSFANFEEKKLHQGGFIAILGDRNTVDTLKVAQSLSAVGTIAVDSS